jgi:hypothetical protein
MNTLKRNHEMVAETQVDNHGNESDFDDDATYDPNDINDPIAIKRARFAYLNFSLNLNSEKKKDLDSNSGPESDDGTLVDDCIFDPDRDYDNIDNDIIDLTSDSESDVDLDQDLDLDLDLDVDSDVNSTSSSYFDAKAFYNDSYGLDANGDKIVDGKNRCMECNIDMGDDNPRQLCGKTICRKIKFQFPHLYF